MTPDWKNDSDYAFTEGLKAHGWAWEYLRRNPQYREDYERVRDVMLKYAEKYGKNSKKWPKEGPAFVFVPPKDPNEDLYSWKNRVGVESGERAILVRLDRHCGRSWGLNDWLFDPDKGVAQGVSFLPPTEYPRLLVNWDEAEDYREIIDIDDGGEVDKVLDEVALVAFDLTLPFKKQLSQAGKLLKGRQDDMKAQDLLTLMFPKNYEANWRTYLRVLDAAAAGASNMDIAKAIGLADGYEYPDPHPSTKVGETLQLADRLVQRGYRKILFMDT